MTLFRNRLRLNGSSRRLLKRLALVALVVGTLGVTFVLAVVFLDDPVSSALRRGTETFLNGQSDRLYAELRSGGLTRGDRALLHAGVLTGVVIARPAYPEASAILFHYVYGDGSDLELPSDYFKQSPYLSSEIAELGDGRHGPIGFEQRRDWRLSLALNPFYLEVQPDRVRISHPRVEFASAGGPPVSTVVPIGKMRLRVYDNLVTALHPTPFAVFAEWKRVAD